MGILTRYFFKKSIILTITGTLRGRGRYQHSCGHIRHSNGTKYVITVGGYDSYDDIVDSSDILTVDDNDPIHSVWKVGNVTNK